MILVLKKSKNYRSFEIADIYIHIYIYIIYLKQILKNKQWHEIWMFWAMWCCKCPEGCSVASLINSLPDMSVDPAPAVTVCARAYTHTHTHTHTPSRTQNWQSIPHPFLSTCEPTCVSICGGERPVVLVRSQCVSSTFPYSSSMSLSAACPPQ